MAVWLPAQNKFYLPPQPSTKVLNTDDYVTRTSVFYHASTDRLLTVGHPYYEIINDKKVVVPKVSPNAYRVFRLRLPDPNNFAFGDKALFDPEKERLVWAVRGLQIGRGQPLGVAISGHVLFDKNADVENPNNKAYENDNQADSRVNLAFDPKQTQMFLLGCKPALGQHWTQASWCPNVQHNGGECPPIELRNTPIEDGDMADIGFGCMNFKVLQQNKSCVPLDIVDQICKYPDYIKMSNDPYGDALFFYVRREQLYARHMFTRSGGVKETIPDSKYAKRQDEKVGTSNYFTTPSGSLVSSEAQLFNRPYWIQRSQGQNNGIAWENQLFLTVLDNTRGTPLNIVIGNTGKAIEGAFKPNDYFSYLRHVEEFEISLILQLCKVKLTPENLAFIHTMNPSIIDAWHLNVTPPSGTIDDSYRYINSLATKCPTNVPTKENDDPYAQFKFWDVDLKERMTEQLDQTNLGRKFLFQTGVLRSGSKRVSTTVHKTRSVKRKRASK